MGIIEDSIGSEKKILEDVKPCPFCGGKPTLEHSWSFWDDDYVVYCDNEGCPIDVMTNYVSYADDAIAIWNTRAKG